LKQKQYKKENIMRKFVLIILLVSAIVVCISCSDSTTSPNSSYGLPYEFPLEEGNAWVYVNVYYENGLIDSTCLDTLYIAGQLEDYFLYSWRPEEYFNLVKNIDNKLVNFGSIHINESHIDTTFYDSPYIWAYYGNTGYIDASYYENYHYNPLDSLHISILNNEPYFGSKYDTYVSDKITRSDNYFSHRLGFSNKLGFACWKSYNEDNDLIRTTKIIEVLEDFYPERILTNMNQKSSNSLNKNYIYSADNL